jgi:hypothetical protein
MSTKVHIFKIKKIFSIANKVLNLIYVIFKRELLKFLGSVQLDRYRTGSQAFKIRSAHYDS